MQIKQQIDGDEGLFFIEKDNKPAGEVRFMINDGEIEIYHTEVDPEFQGQKLGEELIEYAANYARQNQLKVVPSCTFAKTVFARNKALQDVLA
ncbi:GNAT family N-acetyltransferase [Mucilaginibacter sp. PAMB04168]|uniref:GNAT family N-acetyltransferase n=1 Tax=Mucilaginibacter sp. PAMB04168 TaxID=3138567 RepID=UPI0031F602A2